MHVKHTLFMKLCLFFSLISWSTGVYAQNFVVTGKVTSNGESVIGATVQVKGKIAGTITDIDGNYRLTLENSKETLVFSFIGYQSKEVTVNGKNVINVELEEDVAQLEEVVVVGYGTMRKKDLTGAITRISTENTTQSVTSVAEMLRGTVAGFSAGFGTSAKGGGSMLIRGEKSINASNSPLIVLDGVIYSGQMTDINPNDIEQIDVLKDASSTAVYGAKAANGVVLITTKKGTSSTKPIINFSGTWGLSMVNSLPEVYEGEDFINFRRDVEVSKNPSKAATGYFDNPAHMSNADLANWMGNDKGDPTSIWLTRLEFTNTEVNNYLAGRLVDWRDVIYQDVALRQDYTVSVAGKKDEMSYYSSINYLKNESNVRGGGLHSFLFCVSVFLNSRIWLIRLSKRRAL